MNLEAGPDWKARLWRSFGEARCALIDVTDLTPFVIDEVELALRCLGPDRVLFIVNDSLSEPAWQTRIKSQMFALPSEPLQFALWKDTADGRRSFLAQVRTFADTLPQEAAGLKPGAWLLTQSHQPIEGRSGGQGEALREFAFANLVSLGVVALVAWFAAITPTAMQLLWYVPGLALSLMTVVFLLQFLIESASRRDRVLSLVLLALGCLAASPVVITQWLDPPEGVRGVAARIHSSNNLKQIGVAIHNYNGSFQSLPPAITFTPDGKPLLSWRVIILPYIEEDALYREFHLSEPWNSPHNVRLLERIPGVYRSPYLPSEAIPTVTHYRVFLGQDTPFGASRPMAGQMFRVIGNGFGPGGMAPFGIFGVDRKLVDPDRDFLETLMVVEAKEAVPWTKPDELELEDIDLNELPRYLGVSKKGFNCVNTDGSTHFVYWSDKRSAHEWKRLITGGSTPALRP